MSSLIKLHSQNLTFTAISNAPLDKAFTHKWDRVIILIHGFPDNHESFNDLIPILTREFDNTLVIAPALRGYEKSSQVLEGQTRIRHLAQDVALWADELVPNGDVPIHLVGHDWGALATYQAASSYPDKFASVVTLAIPYLAALGITDYVLRVPQQLYYSSYMVTMNLSVFYSRWLEQTGESSYLDRLWKYWSPTYEYSRKDIESVRSTLHQPGVTRLATSYYRSLFRNLPHREVHFPVDFDKVPVLVLAGEVDGCMNKSVFELAASRVSHRNFKTQVLTNLGHFLHREDPTKVGELIVNWFEVHSSKL